MTHHTKTPAPGPAPMAGPVAPGAPSRARASPPEFEFELRSRLLAGDEASFASLVEQYHGALLRLALVFVSSHAVAEEVVQETWVGVLDGLRAFEDHSSLQTWIFRILASRAKARGSRERHPVPLSSLAEPTGDHAPAVDPARFQPNGSWAAAPRRWDDSTLEKLVMQEEALRHLLQAIVGLPPNQRAVLTLRDIDGFNSDEVCNVLEIGETNQRVLLHRARSRLRALLEEYVERK